MDLKWSLPRAGRARRLAAAAAVVVLGAGTAAVPLFTASASAAVPAGVRLMAAHNGVCIQVRNEDTGRIAQFPCMSSIGTDHDDEWHARPMSDGTYQIYATHSGKCMNVEDGATANGAAIVALRCNPAASTARNDRFTFVPVNGKSLYQIKAVHSGKCVTVPGGTRPFQSIVQYTCSDSGLNDRWYFTPTMSPEPVSVAQTTDSPVAAVQGGGDSADAPVTYAFVNRAGYLYRAHQPNPDVWNNLTFEPISGDLAVTGQPRVGRQKDGRVQIVAHSRDEGDVLLATQGVKGSPVFGTWHDVGGAAPFQPALGKLPNDGDLVAFALMHGAVWQLPQDGRNVPYMGWRIAGGGAGLTGTPGVVTTRDGIRLFALNGAGAVRTATYANGALSSWVDLGGSGFTGTPAAVAYPGALTRVFATTADGRVLTKAQQIGGAWDAEWKPVGDLTVVGAPAAVVDPRSGITYVVARGTDDYLHYVGETTLASGEWGTWRRLSERTSTVAPTVFLMTRSSGTTWAVPFRDSDDQGYVITADNAASPSARSSRSGPASFTEHKLPVAAK